MNVLDTHTLVWALNAPKRLSAPARRLVEQGDVVVSAVSLWELMLKKGRRNEIVPDPAAWWRRHVRGSGASILPILDSHIARLDALPPHHADPFDRILVCQAIHEGMRLVTNDKVLRRHYQPYIGIVW